MLKSSSFKTHSLYQLINDATDNLLRSEDELLNKKICSEILRTSDGPKVAGKIINKILNKSLTSHCNQSVWYCLLLLDTAVKSTDSRFCATVLAKDFFGDLTKIMDPKYQVPDFVQEKFLYLVKEWAKSLVSVPGYSNLDRFYRIQMTPVVTVDPKRPYPLDRSSLPNVQPQISPTMNQMTIDKERLIKDIDIIETNLSIFSDTLRTVNPSDMTAEECQFLKDLHDTVKRMQTRINDILPVLVWEDVTNQLLQVNDKINSTSERYLRLMSSKTQQLLATSNPDTNTNAHLEDIYERTEAFSISNPPTRVVNDVYDIPSLPSYSEASSNLSKINSQRSKEPNLINFDEEFPKEFNTRMPLPPIPTNSAPDFLTGSISSPNDPQNRMSSDEFDDFIEAIARRHKPTSEAVPEEEYAPPIYDEASHHRTNHL